MENRFGWPARLRALALSLGLGAVLLVPAGAALAATLSSVGVALNAGNSPDLLDNFALNGRERSSAAALLASDASSFSSQYAATLGVDARFFAATDALTLDADYTIQIVLSAAVGEAWQLTVDTRRTGALTLEEDGGGSAGVQLGAVNASLSGATLAGGSLGLTAVGGLVGDAGGDLPFDQSATAILTGVGTGAPQAISLTFTFSATADTVAVGGNGDEGALRLGTDSSLFLFGAGGYPGAGNRALAGDGHFVSASLTSVPQPGSFALVCLGLLGLACFGSRFASQPGSG